MAKAKTVFLNQQEMDEKEMSAEANRIAKRILDKHKVEPHANDLIEKRIRS